MPGDFELVPFDRDDANQQAFVYDSFRRSTSKAWPWCEWETRRLMEALKRELASPDTETRLIIPRGVPGAYVGWLATRAPRQIVFAFVKYAYRRMGVGVSALRRMGIDPSESPVGVRFWTPACARLARDGGYAIYFDNANGYEESEWN